MKHMKKLSAALLVAVMVISMLSCMVFNVSAAQFELGGPVTIEKLPVRGTSLGTGIVTGGRLLNESGILVVNSDWAKAEGTQPIKLGGITYNVTIGVNGFAEVAEAMEVAVGHETIYVAPGLYEGGFSQTVGNIKIYGPYAGVNPNDKDISKPNAKRPAAAGVDAPTDTEAVLTGGVSFVMTGSDLVMDGLYLGGSFNFNSDALMASAENYRYGTVVKNCIFNNIIGNKLFNLANGNNPSVEITDNRVLNGKDLVYINGLMDLKIANNYLNLSGNTVETLKVTAGSMGSYALIENNYFEYSGGNVFKYAHEVETALYTAIVRNNYIADMGAAAFVHNTFYGAHSLPGVNLQISGNKVMKIDAGQTVFEFPYVVSQEYPYRFGFIVNINENYFDIPANTMFVESGMNGSLNLSHNYYTTPISVDRITKYEETKLILYPCYADEAMTTLKGDACFTAATPYIEIDNVNKVVTIDLAKATEPLTSVELDKALETPEGCTWKLYKEVTLTNEVANKIAYPAGAVTQYFAAITAADGTALNIYEIRLLSADGADAALIDVIMDNTRVSGPEINGNVFTYTFPKDVAFVDYEIKVSAGATYELYADYDQQSNEHVAFEDIGNYIPYGGYQFDVVVTAQNELDKNVFTVVFERDRSETYDPSLIGGKTPTSGTYSVLRNGALLFISDQLLTKATFDLTATPNATYTVYSDDKKTEVLSSSAKLEEISLKEGESTFYVEVSDGKNTNLVPFVVRNEKRSAVADIVGMVGLSPIINNNVITVQSSGNSINVVFKTSDPYAVIKVYADAARKIALDYTSNPIEEEPNRFVDERTFNLDITHATSKYYVDCIAENGAVNQYDLIVTKIVKVNEYIDVIKDAWYEDYVDAATESGVLQGSSVGTAFEFRPNDNTTREEMAVVASRLLGINSASYDSVKLPFKDANSIASWALGNVKVVYATGVMKGSQDANGLNFRPKSDISRQEVIAMFVRMFGLTGSYDLSEFKDHTSVSSWAKADMEAAVASGLIEGSDGKLNPQKAITRAELAAMISRV